MCWRAFKKRDKRVRVADEDITVFKVVRKVEDGLYLSYYKDYPYYLGRAYEMKGLSHKEIDGNMRIEEGFHSYSSKECYICIPYNNFGQIYILKQKTWELSAVYDDIYDLCIIECTIPKGSKYYRNYYGEIVSDKIIINKEIPREEW